MRDLIIIGAGGLGREVAWLVERINQIGKTWQIVGFLDDNKDFLDKTINGYKVVGDISQVLQYKEAYFVCAVGASAVREKLVSAIKDLNPNIRFATLIDPTVPMSDSVNIGEGSIICINSVITVNITIGNHVIVSYGSTIGHDVILKDFVTLYPNTTISGAVNIGRCTELGVGMQVIQGKTIGDYSIVGAGAVVIHDIPEKCTAVGSPARPIKYFD